MTTPLGINKTGTNLWATKPIYRDFKLHVEWMEWSPDVPKEFALFETVTAARLHANTYALSNYEILQIPSLPPVTSTPFGIRKIGTNSWASLPVRKGDFSIIEWGDREDAMEFGSILDIGPFIAEYNLKNCEAVRFDDAPTSTQAYFADLDKFLKYVHERMNPARIREGLLTINDGQATHIYDAIKEGRYLRP